MYRKVKSYRILEILTGSYSDGWLLRGFFFDLNGKEITDYFGFIPETQVISC